VNGLQFPVDEITPVDENSTKLRIGKTIRLIAKDKVHEWVVEESLKNPETRSHYSNEELKKFVTSSLKLGQRSPAEWGIIGLINAQPDEAGIAEVFNNAFIDSLLEIPAAAGTIKAVLSNPVIPARANGPLVAILALLDAPSLHGDAARHLLLSGDQIKYFLTSKILESFSHREFDRGQRITRILKEIFPDNDPVVFRFENLQSRVQGALQIGRTGNIDKLLPLLDLETKDVEAFNALRPFIFETIHIEATRAIADGNADDALIALSHIGAERSTPTTLELVRQALENFQPKGRVYFAPEVDRLLVKLGEMNESVKNRYVALLAKQIAEAAARHSMSSAEMAFVHLKEVNRDPSSVNDWVRVRLAVGYVRTGEIGRADRELAQNSRPLEFDDKWRLFRSGYYIEFRWLFIAVFAPIVALLILYRRSNVRVARMTRDLGTTGIKSPLPGRAMRGMATDSVPPAFSQNVASRIGRDPRFIDYTDNLGEFDLPESATLAEIKNAYRQAVKQAHPDAQKDTIGIASERFIVLTNAYEKILELRKQLNLRD